MVNNYPNLFVVGAPRSGTTAMCLYLKQHPSIHVSILKEPHYFATDLMVQPHAITETSDYLKLFANSAINAEGSVWYLTSKAAAHNIHTHCKGAKVIIMLRRPWEQIQSLHSLYLRTGNEDQSDLERAISLCKNRREGKCIPPASYFHDGLQYLNNASYYQHVKRYIEIFGKNVKVILFDDFIKDTRRIMAETFDFIGAAPFDDIEFDQQQATLKIRNTALRQLKQLPDNIRNKLHRNHVRVHKTGQVSSMSRPLKQYLMNYYYTDIQSTANLLERDLIGLWYE
ncbi:sulfotransferase domain-containing protein [Pseudoalteromonas obscura]|uniref:Sulfotransferase n=1 Tax=Pseudoalteromonas obscura TaxID=3048491 RepID=A0ABT7EMV8_9GAMM|nr:sulfotransferase domain-containing protein [Pseudoalteromonas sp. P94(2023)]MDK2596376.1 sulfotransferase [Pseudoalteromonas sp. P94(2023)]